jgi:hypothetical protein
MAKEIIFIISGKIEANLLILLTIHKTNFSHGL